MKWSDLEPSTKVILKVIVAFLTVAFIWAVRDIVIIVLLAIVLASAMEPLVAYLHKRHIPRAVSVIAVYLLVLGLGVLILSLIVPLFISQFNLLAANFPQYSQQLQDQYPSFNSLFASINDGLHNVFSTGGSAIFNRTLGVFNGFLSAVTILVISFYLVAEQRAMIKFIRSLVPPKHQQFTMNLVDKIQRRMGRWVIGQIILSVCIFALSYLGLTLLGVKYALLLALLAGLLEVLPYIGPFISAVPAIIFALIQSPALALAVAILYLIIQKTEGYFLVPKIMEKTVGTSPLLVLVALLVGYQLAGILGLLLSVPLVSAITLVITEMTANQVLQHELDEPPLPLG